VLILIVPMIMVIGVGRTARQSGEQGTGK